MQASRDARILTPFFRKSWPIYSLGLILLIAVDLLQLLIPKLTGQAIDLVAGKGEGAFGKIIWEILAVAVLIAILRFFYREFLMGTTRHLEYYLRERLFTHALRLPMSYFDIEGPGKIMALSISDITAIRMAAGLGALLIVDAVVMGIASFLYMARDINLQLTWISVLPLPLVLGVAAWLGKPVHNSYRIVQEKFSRLTEFAQETFSGIRVIKGFAAESGALERFADVSQENVVANIAMAKLQAIYVPLTHTAPLICYAVAIYRGGQLVIAGQITIGDLTAFIGYLGLIIWPVMGLGFLMNTVQRGSASLARIAALLEKPLYETDSQATDSRLPAEEVRFQNLSFQYPTGSVPALRNVSLTIPSGAFVGVVGRTGSGKSTLLRLLLRLYDPAPGSIFLGGKEIHSIDYLTLRDSIGYVPQEGLLFSRPISDNIGFDQNYSREEIMEAARLATVREDINAKPEGFCTVLGEKGHRLSGGQQQRVAIARAVIKKPGILLLDDVFSALDYRTQTELLNHLKGFSQGRTAIVVSQRIAAVKEADFIVVLDEGRVAEVGTHQELLASGGLYHRLYEQQLVGGED